MKLFTASQMRALDRAAIEGLGIPSLELMERAGDAVARAVVESFPKKGRVSIVVGKGNNGGDGLVAARFLLDASYQVSLFLLSPWKEFSDDARANWEKLAGRNIDVHELTPDNDLKRHSKILEGSVCIVDAILGTGLLNEVTGRYRLAIEFINSLTKPVVAVDIPSGLSADTGQPLGAAVRARLTVTFAAPKVGLYTGEGAEYAREIKIADIGIPKTLIDSATTLYTLTTPDVVAPLFGKRRADSHKGDFGHVLVVGGASGKIGAGLLASRGALRCGAGIVTYALADAAYTKFDVRSPEVMYEGLADKGRGYLVKESISQIKQLLNGKSALVLGPGIGTHDDTKAVVLDIVGKIPVPLVLDADGLNCIADRPAGINGKKAPIVITPHPGEMSKLTGIPVAKIQNDRIGVARQFAKAHGVVVVLKGFRSVIALPTGEIFINPTGGPAMATAGMGDVLSGVIAGFIAQKIQVPMAAVAAVYVHGMAGDLAAKKVGERGLIASDVINSIPEAIKQLV